MNVLVAPDKFKGSLSAVAAAEAIARGWRQVFPSAQINNQPIADGGEGFAETLRAALGGTWIETSARDPIGREVSARYAWIEAEKLAILDMSEASGLWRLKPGERDPLRANTFGTGQLIRHAAERGARKIFVGLGGSATTDGGIGMAAALGYQCLTSDGDALEPFPSHLTALVRISDEEVIDLPEIVAACDVTNPLLGPRGSARVFGPQKGANPKTVEALEYGLETLAEIVTQEFGSDFRDAPGAGAAGGIGFGLMSFCRAKMQPGFDLVAEALRLEEQIAACDLVITGEGRLDAQTLDGKGPAGVAALAQKHGKPVLALAGSIDSAAPLGALFTAALAIVDEPVALDEALRRAPEFLERAATRAARLVQLGTLL